LHRSIENQGVDFWWIDWQQGSHSRVPGIDPLWVLNHFHFLDNMLDHKRPLTFSRYAGPGSHRYPVGFSGDTIVTWDSLAFQPEFTATSSNIGYGWWSHDIGGHMFGKKDDELSTRWVQLGCFSPIMRLHSSNSQWTRKEPWTYSPEAGSVMTNFLRFRHRLLPYLYTMNARSAIEGVPLVRPMYWSFPERKQAYQVKNQYLFGTELIVVPITEPQDPKLRLAKTKGWLPPGRYVDIFSGAIYDGDRMLWLSRKLEDYPVFAKEGSIIPLDASSEPGNGAGNPDSIEILVVAGSDGEFELLEDDGSGRSSDEVKWIRTHLKYSQGNVTIGPSNGGGTRSWRIILVGVYKLRHASIVIGNYKREVNTEKVKNGILIQVGTIPPDAQAIIFIDAALSRNNIGDLIKPILANAQIEFKLKEEIWQIVVSGVPSTMKVSGLDALDMNGNLRNAVLEYVLAEK